MFAASKLNEPWLTDITEYWTGEGKLYLCAIKDACSGRIVSYSISDPMESRLAVQALENAIAIRGDVPAAWSTRTRISMSKPQSSVAR